jgi:hypothetical protein
MPSTSLYIELSTYSTLCMVHHTGSVSRARTSLVSLIHACVFVQTRLCNFSTWVPPVGLHKI